ncbi:DUF5666 domain-containing protein [Inmirania thermothiophila]|uniref:DUF5666 domain-containing protein n=1 Tax=Inmirania thermothiophila TaxID=1750597 RepID=A0A3N1Y8B9_9GAMM|nr:DUF5666 domain-containing protein [Inmirania thermothiophila]ROR35010.1 hypothetical protein EDC57_0927 [Inmirania thermothiophila]
MSRLHRIARMITAAAALGVLTSCGGGGGAALLLGGGGIGGTGISFGPILLIGSVKVNGVTFQTPEAEVFVEGQSVGKGDAVVKARLKEGMVVTVDGDIETATSGKALEVRFDRLIEGPLEGAPGNGVITVLGQTVVLDANVFVYRDNGPGDPFHTASAADLAPGQRVEISGLLSASGPVLATYVRILDDHFDPAEDVEVTGRVTATGSGTITLGGLTVHLPPAAPVIAVGDTVEVKGTVDGAGPPYTAVTATAVALEDPVTADPDDDAEIEGFVTATEDSDADGLPDAFTLHTGNRVVVATGTAFEHGTAADLVPNARVEVEGVVGADGTTVTADKVEFKETRIRIEATLAGDPAAGPVTFFGGALTVEADDLTELEGGPADGDYVKLSARRLEDGTLVATEIEKKSDTAPPCGIAGEEVELQGVAQGLPPAGTAAGDFTVEGVKVVFDAATAFEPPDLLARAADGDLVKVKGCWDGAAIAADEIELED